MDGTHLGGVASTLENKIRMKSDPNGPKFNQMQFSKCKCEVLQEGCKMGNNPEKGLGTMEHKLHESVCYCRKDKP